MTEPEASKTSLESRLGVFLLKDPTMIERLPSTLAKLLDKLVEANSLEPVLYHLVEENDALSTISADRLSRWKMSRLCSSARASSYRATFDELIERFTEANVPVRLLRSTQVAFYLCEDPELHPIAELELQVPLDRSVAAYKLLKSHGFNELDDLAEIAESVSHHLPRLERDGVTVTLFKRSCLGLGVDPDDPFPMLRPVAQNNPEVLRGEPLMTLLVLEIFEQCFRRALATLLDLHRVLHQLKIDWAVVSEIVARLGAERHFFCICRLLQELFDSPVDAEFLQKLEAHDSVTQEFASEALPLARRLVVTAPIPLDELRQVQGYFAAEEVHDAELARETQVLPRLNVQPRP